LLLTQAWQLLDRTGHRSSERRLRGEDSVDFIQ
jgi:hypothetical protein